MLKTLGFATVLLGFCNVLLTLLLVTIWLRFGYGFHNLVTKSQLLVTFWLRVALSREKYGYGTFWLRLLQKRYTYHQKCILVTIWLPL